jgi:hypothetical protein
MHDLLRIYASLLDILQLITAASTVCTSADEPLIVDGMPSFTRGQMIWIKAHTINRRVGLFPSPEEIIPDIFCRRQIIGRKSQRVNGVHLKKALEHALVKNFPCCYGRRLYGFDPERV